MTDMEGPLLEDIFITGKKFKMTYMKRKIVTPTCNSVTATIESQCKMTLPPHLSRTATMSQTFRLTTALRAH